MPVIHKKGMSIVQHSMYTKSFIKAKEGSLLSCVLLKPTYLKKAKMMGDTYLTQMLFIAMNSVAGILRLLERGVASDAEILTQRSLTQDGN